MSLGHDGQRVRLIRCTDQHTDIEPGAEGRIAHVDSLGTRHVDWDDGRRLGLIPGEDSWEVIAGGEEEDRGQ